MSLQPGQTLGHYRLAEKIGEGGMGVVWKAVDTSLDRPVAIKVLPEAFTADGERLARFEREARLLASLNHPQIASVYGFHSEGGLRYIAMEYLAGEDLSDRLARGTLETRQAVRIALQVAEALETAHENGVIHRDLKPANIKFTSPASTVSGSVAATAVESVKVLDFGLAKGMDEAAAGASVTQSPTLTAAATRDGVILGTAAYMSPEQARGHAADRRSDIWSFGAVLYEMLAGHRPFAGDTVSDTLAAVLRADVDFAGLPADTPPAVRRLLRRCLEKDPRHRQQAMGDARIVLENVLAGRDEDEGIAPPGEAPRAAGSPLLMAAAGLMVGVVATAGLLLFRTPEPAPTPLLKVPLPLAIEDGSSGENPEPMISPDGRSLIFAAGDSLVLRRLDQWDTRTIAEESGIDPLGWSPDSRFFAFESEGKLWKYSIEGGQGTVVTDLPENGSVRMANWGDGGRILVVTYGGSIVAVPERGGDPVPVLDPDPETEDDFHNVLDLPGEAGMVFVVHVLNEQANRIDLIRGDERRTLLKLEKAVIGHVIYSTSGHLVFERFRDNGGIWAVPYSLAEGSVTGEPFLVAAGGASPSVSGDGTLAYVSGFTGKRELVLVNRQGQIEQPIGQPQERLFSPRLSPDGTRVAVEGVEDGESDLWVHDIERGTMTRLTFEEGGQRYPEWTPDGTRVAYFHIEAGSPSLRIRSADGTGAPTILVERCGHGTFTPDGNALAVETLPLGENDFNLMSISLAGDRAGEPQPLAVQPDVNERMPEISPDGRFVAYRSDESGRDEIYIRPFPEGEGKWQVSTQGGTAHRWNGDGSELYYAHGTTLLAVPVDLSGEAPRLGRPEALFDWVSRFLLEIAKFDAAPDGQRFVMVHQMGNQQTTREMRLVQSWYAEFEDGR